MRKRHASLTLLSSPTSRSGRLSISNACPCFAFTKVSYTYSTFANLRVDGERGSDTVTMVEREEETSSFRSFTPCSPNAWSFFCCISQDGCLGADGRETNQIGLLCPPFCTMGNLFRRLQQGICVRRPFAAPLSLEDVVRSVYGVGLDKL